MSDKIFAKLNVFPEVLSVFSTERQYFQQRKAISGISQVKWQKVTLMFLLATLFHFKSAAEETVPLKWRKCSTDKDCQVIEIDVCTGGTVSRDSYGEFAATLKPLRCTPATRKSAEMTEMETKCHNRTPRFSVPAPVCHEGSCVFERASDDGKSNFSDIVTGCQAFPMG